MEGNANRILGGDKLNMIFFKTCVAHILTQVVDDIFFLHYEDDKIPGLLYDTFQDNHDEAKKDTEEDVSAKVTEFFKSGTDSEKQLKALEVAKMIVAIQEPLTKTEIDEIVGNLEKVGERLKKEAVAAEQVSLPSDVDPVAAVTTDFKVLLAWDSKPSGKGGEESKMADPSNPIQPAVEGSIKTKKPAVAFVTKKVDTTKRPSTAAGRMQPKGRLDWVMTPSPKVGKNDWVLGLRDGPKPSWRQTKSRKMKSRSKGKGKGKRKLKKKTSLRSMIKSKMLGISFMAHASDEVDQQRAEKKKATQDANHLKAWMRKKEKHKIKMPKFDVRKYQPDTNGAKVHNLTVGGLRNPYDLEGVQFFPAERLGVWKNEKGKEKEFVSTYKSAQFPTAHNRNQKHPLRTKTSPRRAIKPQTLSIGGYGSVEWIMTHVHQDDAFRKHSQAMKMLQQAKQIISSEGLV